MNYDYSDDYNNLYQRNQQYNEFNDNNMNNYVNDYYGVKLPIKENPETPKLHSSFVKIDVNRIKNNFFNNENHKSKFSRI